MDKILLLLVLLTMTSCAAAASKTPPLETVPYVEVSRYTGVWYQIALFPTRFQRGDCPVTTAEYGIDEKGIITVYNVCWDDENMTKIREDISGTASVTAANNAKLKVRFFWWLPVRANYWIISLDEENYSYAVVSEAKRKYLWILARENRMDKDLFNEIKADLENRGFDLTRLKVTAPLD